MLLLCVLFSLSSFLARVTATRNPTLHGFNTTSPRIIYDNKAYYMTLGTNNKTHYFPIYRSVDLQNWGSVGWALVNPKTISGINGAAHIVNVDNEYRLYFGGYSKTTIRTAIYVAYAFDILGPYILIDKPLLDSSTTGGDMYNPFVLKEGTDVKLYYQENKSTFYVKKLDSLGLEVSPIESDATTVFNAADNEMINMPMVYKKESDFFLFFSKFTSSSVCMDTVFVASQNITTRDLFENPTAISLDDFEFSGSSAAFVLQKLTTIEIVYNAFRGSCTTTNSSVLIKTLNWNSSIPVTVEPIECPCRGIA